MTLGHGHFGPANALWLAAAALLGLLLYRVERRLPAPLLDLALLRHPGLAVSLVSNTLVAAVMMTTLVVGPFYLTRALGLSPAAAGFALSLGPLVAALAGVPAGRLVDRFGAARPLRAALAGMSLAAAAISLGSGLLAYLLPVALLTASYALFQAANQTAVLRAIPDAHRGVASGLMSLARNLGLITGASTLAALFAATGVRATFLAAALLLAFALLLVSRARTQME